MAAANDPLTSLPAHPESIPLPPPAAAPQAPGPAPEQVEAQVRRFDGLLVVAVLIFAFLAGSFTARNTDVFQNLAVGRLVAEGKYPFGDDPFTFPGAQPGAGWINHAWLPSLFAYLLYSIHPATLVVLKALMIVVLAELMMRTGHLPGKRLGLPAVLTGLAILAMSPRLLLQPVCFSYLFLGLTLWLLERPRLLAKDDKNGPLTSWWFLPPLFLLWVNSDQWFFLGPLTVGLYWLGELIQKRDADRLKRLGLVFGIGLAVCLVNPYGYKAFILPPQLGFAAGMEKLQADPVFRGLTVAAYQAEYFRPGESWNLAALAYFALALLSGASFGLTGGLPRWRLCVWLPFFLLSFFHSRAVPFFAVIAAPITALNFLDFATRKLGDFALGGDRGRRFALGGRVLAILAAVLLVTSAAMGRLQGRSIAWGVEVDPLLEKAARKMAAGADAAPVRYFNLSPDVGNYLSWFGLPERGSTDQPRVRVFMDHRLPLYPDAAADYVTVRRALERREPVNEEEGTKKEAPWPAVFRKWDVHSLIVHEQDYFSQLPLLQGLLLAPDEWTLQAFEGRTMVFGWEDPADDGPRIPSKQLRLERLAFGPDVVPLTSQEPLVAPDAGDWWSLIWKGEPPRSPHAREATTDLAFFEAAQAGTMKGLAQAWEQAWTAGVISGAGGPGGPLANGTFDRSYFQRPIFERYLAGQDRGPPAALYLAVRACRQALAENPIDARTHVLLGQAYLSLARATREGSEGMRLAHLHTLRRAQAVSSIRRGLALKPNLHEGHLLLAQIFERQYADIGLKHRAAYLEGLKEQVEEINEADRRNLRFRITAQQEQVQQMEQLVKNLRDQCDIKSAGQSVLRKAQIAHREFHLADKALDLLKKARPDELEKAAGKQGEDVARILRIQLYVELGMLDDLREEVRPNLERLMGFLPELQVPELAWYQFLAAASAGDYELADEFLGKLESVSTSQQSEELLRAMSIFGSQSRDAAVIGPTQVGSLLLGQYLLREAADATHVSNVLNSASEWYAFVFSQASQGPGGPRGYPMLTPRPKQQLFGAAVQASRNLLLFQANLAVVRGVLALEAGNIARAREHFQRVTALLGNADPAPPPLALAQMYLGWLAAAKP